MEKKREYLEDLGFRKDLLSHGTGPGVKPLVQQGAWIFPKAANCLGGENRS